MITTHQAKKLTAQYLEDNGIKYTKLSAKTVSFSDLARASMVFVTVFGVPRNVFLPKNTRDFERAHGFRIKLDGHIN